MGIAEVRRFFKDGNWPYEIIEHAAGTETVAAAAATLGVEPALIAKTLAFKMGTSAVLIVTRGDARIDNRKFRDFFGAKARMLPAEEVLALTGHAVGGVCPFGLKTALPVYLDLSLKAFEKVYPAAGSDNSCIAIAPADLALVTGGQWIDVCS